MALVKENLAKGLQTVIQDAHGDICIDEITELWQSNLEPYRILNMMLLGNYFDANTGAKMDYAFLTYYEQNTGRPLSAFTRRKVMAGITELVKMHVKRMK